MCGQTQHHLSQHISWQERHANWPMMAMVLPHSTKMHLLYSGVASFHVLCTAHWPRPQGRCEKWSACTKTGISGTRPHRNTSKRDRQRRPYTL